MMLSAAWLLAVMPLFALALTVFNAIVWPRRAAGGAKRHVSILIPARNEERTIAATVRSALANDPVEVLVYDDQSTDATPEILREIAAEDARLRVVEARELPVGWVGKPHACHRLSEQARGDVLLFVDADVELFADGVDHITSVMGQYDAQALTAVPRQRVGTFVERLILPLLHVTYVSWLPLPLIWRSRDPRFLAANGQVLAVDRAAYDAAGGFAAVRDAVVDDMAFCAALKTTGTRVVFADGHIIARCRMYGSAREVWEGFSKNIFEGIGSGAGLLAAIALYFATFVAPWLGLIVGGAVLIPAAVGVAANVTQRVLLAVRHGHPPEGVLLVPLATLALCAIAVNSWIWHMRNDIRWSGRTYARKEARDG